MQNGDKSIGQEVSERKNGKNRSNRGGMDRVMSVWERDEKLKNLQADEYGD